MPTFSKPDPMNGEALQAELEAAGFAEATVSDNGVGSLVVVGVSDGDRDGVQQVLDAHVPPAPADVGPTAQDVLEAIRELAAEGAEVEKRIHERANAKAQERAQA